MPSVSIYFYAGDFADVMRRHDQGRQQIYQTHDEVARLVYQLLAAGCRVNFYSFITPEQRIEQPLNGFRFISLGAQNYLTEKNKTNTPDKLKFVKYCNWCKKRTEHKESTKLK